MILVLYLLAALTAGPIDVEYCAPGNLAFVSVTKHEFNQPKPITESTFHEDRIEFTFLPKVSLNYSMVRKIYLSLSTLRYMYLYVFCYNFQFLLNVYWLVLSIRTQTEFLISFN